MVLLKLYHCGIRTASTSLSLVFPSPLLHWGGSPHRIQGPPSWLVSVCFSVFISLDLSAALVLASSSCSFCVFSSTRWSVSGFGPGIFHSINSPRQISAKTNLVPGYTWLPGLGVILPKYCPLTSSSIPPLPPYYHSFITIGFSTFLIICFS